HNLFFKEFRLVTPLKWAAIFLGAVGALYGAGYLMCHWYALLTAVGAWFYKNSYPYEEAILGITALIGLLAVFWNRAAVWLYENFFSVFGLFLSNIHLRLGLNRLFKRRGRLERLLNLK